MAKSFRLMGHPLHPAVVHFPMGLLPLSFVWDLVSLWRGATWEPFAFWTLTAGLIALLPALVTGILDFMAIPDDEKKAVATAYWHMGVMILAASFFTVSLFLRMGTQTPLSPTPLAALALSAVGMITLMGGGYLGGELVYKHGIGHEEKK